MRAWHKDRNVNVSCASTAITSHCAVHCVRTVVVTPRMRTIEVSGFPVLLSSYINSCDNLICEQIPRDWIVCSSNICTRGNIYAWESCAVGVCITYVRFLKV